MIDEKSLERAVRQATKGGLLVLNDGVTMTLAAREWIARMLLADMQERQRPTLGALVEMLGYVPQGILSIQRIKGGEYLAQCVMDDVAAGTLAEFDGEELDEIAPTPLSWGSYRLWQRQNSNEIYGVHAGAPHNATATTPILLDGGRCVVIRDGFDETVVRCARPDEDDERRRLWEKLETERWN